MERAEMLRLLGHVVQSRQALIAAYGRKRSMRDSEKAMAVSSLRRQIEALQMAIVLLKVY